jgi:integrase
MDSITFEALEQVGGLSAIKETIKALLLSVSIMEGNLEPEMTDDAGKKYGFSLMKVWNTEKTDFTYAVRYKDLQTGKYILTKTNTQTNDKKQADTFAIKNRDKIIKKFYEKKELRKNSGKNFYSMLLEYYTANSKYLKDDSANGKRTLNEKQLVRNRNFIKKHLIPYLKENKIGDIEGITRQVYSNLKNYLQTIKTTKGENISVNSSNNHLFSINRILQYAERNELISKLPYVKGIGKIKDNGSDKKQPALLPTEYITGIFSPNFIGNTENSFFLFLLSAIGLCCGLRNSEIGRIKREDILYIKSNDSYFMKVWNHKTEYHNKQKESKYRKMPLHKFLVDALKLYIEITDKKPTDYLFGVVNKKGEPILSHRFTANAIFNFYKRVKIKEQIKEMGNFEKALLVDTKKLKAEMKEKNIVYYSFRHTFETMLGIKYPQYTLLIDYFMGHKPQASMLGNYLHINQVDNETFFREYGKKIIDFQDQFIHKELKVLNDYLKKTIDKKSVNGRISENDIFSIVNTLIPKKESSKKEDSFFESV